MPDALRPRPTPLPTKIDDWDRKIKQERTLNDHVEDVHIMLWDESTEYRAFLEAVWDSDAVEGSLSVDNVMAAQLIRNKAGELENSPVAKKKLDTILKSLGVVMRRYENSRKERRHTVQGVRVPAPPENGE